MALSDDIAPNLGTRLRLFLAALLGDHVRGLTLALNRIDLKPGPWLTFSDSRTTADRIFLELHIRQMTASAPMINSEAK
jgi:hypothetical protein